MTGYFLSGPVLGLFAVLSLLTTVLYLIILLVSGEFYTRSVLLIFRAYYSFIAFFLMLSSYDLILTASAIEGGLFIDISDNYRYIVLLGPAIALIFLITYKNLCPELQPETLSCFILLLRLPKFDFLSWPWPVFFWSIFMLWFFVNAIRLLINFACISQNQITKGVMPKVLNQLNIGICICNSHGRFLEYNQAFSALAKQLDADKCSSIFCFKQKIDNLKYSYEDDINLSPNYCFVRINGRVVSCKTSNFSYHRRQYIQLILSDITQTAEATRKLNQKNLMLKERTMLLEKSLKYLEHNETLQQRDQLCRTAHDQWSQRLAVAGLSLDLMLEKSGDQTSRLNLREIDQLLAANNPLFLSTPNDSLDISLISLQYMYRKLGVSIIIDGQGSFSASEQASLIAIIKEACANSLRHSFAREIKLYFRSKHNSERVIVKNVCHDNETVISENRGLYDMRTRAQEAGGTMSYRKGRIFVVLISFPRESVLMEEMSNEGFIN